MLKMNAMPKLGSITRKCVCGCGQLTKGTWASGHDGRATGWAIRIERNVMTIDQVPSNERNGAMLMLNRRKALKDDDVQRNAPAKATA